MPEQTASPLAGTQPGVRVVHVVPHTHWDREWYRTFESYRYRLVKTLDRVLDSDLPYFLLDGQTAVLDDYLALRPERGREINARIAEGRLGAGPWYVLVDEFLVSGESLVRNLLVGRAAMTALGATGAVGYLPDMFGHIAQMPQVLSQFGLDTAVVWRGANPGVPRFRWVSPDGSEVATAWLPLGYYQTMLMEDLTPAARKQQLEAYLTGFGDAERLWLLSGADHMAPRTDLTQQLSALEAELPGLTLTVSPLAEALAGPRPDVALHGELRDPAKAYILPGVLSTRTPLKQANVAAQVLLERYVEPLTALAWWLGGPHPTPFLTHAWKTLMLNHPHDSICGCSIDQVHREMWPRFAAVAQVGEELLADAVGLADRPGAAPTVYVYNPTAAPWEGWLDLTIDWPRPREGAAGDAAPDQVGVLGPDGAALLLVRRAEVDTEVFRAEIDFNPDWFPVRRYTVAVRVAVPAAGGVLLTVQAGEPATPEVTLKGDDQSLENAHLRLKRTDEGFTLTDKRSGAEFANCHGFVDESDAGDEYNFSPLANDTLRRARLVSTALVAHELHQAVLEAVYELDVPAALAPDRQTASATIHTLTIRSRFTLASGDTTVAVETRFDNTAHDHRLRLLVGWPQPEAPRVFAEGTFGVFERAYVADPALPAAKGTEAIMPEFPQQGFSLMTDGARSLGLAQLGLHEASLMATDAGWALAVTLLRSVGWLSRDDLRTRGGGAGPRFETPEGQCLGAQVFRYALTPGDGDWAPLMTAAHQFIAPPRAWLAEGPGAVGSAVTLGDDRLVLSALKRSEGGDRLVIRAYNPLAETIEGTLSVAVPHKAIRGSMMDERVGDVLGKGQVAIVMGPYEVRTWLIER